MTNVIDSQNDFIYPYIELLFEVVNEVSSIENNKGSVSFNPETLDGSENWQKLLDSIETNSN